jgi:hypothetical protein
MKKNSFAPDYTHSILNLTNSILADFGITPFHSTLPELDRILAHGSYNHVALIVCDAMGSMNLDELLPEDSFLRTHRVTPISSVFPPTTTAATTTLMSGLSPAQHGWIGWQPYIPALNDAVELFPNNIPDRLVHDGSGDSRIEHPDEKPPFAVGMKYLPYKDSCTLINETGSAKASLYATFFPAKDPYRVNTFPEIANAILSECAATKRTFTYCYWPQPDTAMHHTGVTSQQTHAEVDLINTTLQQLDARLRAQEEANAAYGKTLVIVTADHGHLDSESIVVSNYPDLLNTLSVTPCLEPRAITFFVKESARSTFPKLFFSHFSEDDFMLLTKDELLTSKLLGPVTKALPEQPLVKEMIGDFIAIAIGKKSMFNSKEKADLHKGMHAGLCQKELLVPLITF